MVGGSSSECQTVAGPEVADLANSSHNTLLGSTSFSKNSGVSQLAMFRGSIAATSGPRLSMATVSLLLLHANGSEN